MNGYVYTCLRCQLLTAARAADVTAAAASQAFMSCDLSDLCIVLLHLDTAIMPLAN